MELGEQAREYDSVPQEGRHWPWRPEDLGSGPCSQPVHPVLFLACVFNSH